MQNIERRLAPLGLAIPEILLPRNVDLEKWAVIACDQFTQDRGYWETARNAVAGAPSTLNLIFPEVFLDDGDRARRIADIHRAMESYLREGIFAAPRRGFVYLERDTPHNRGRRGLVAALDLEQYDWSPAARPLIRSTEGTVPERLPPRMDVRRGAALETPHIIVLIDDDTDTLLPGLAEQAQKSAPVYQTRLLPDSGGVSGWFLDAESGWAFLAAGLEALARRAAARYVPGGSITPNAADNAGGAAPFLFAVGDGNHSLAAAKGVWEEYKRAHGVSGGGLPVHPCRYALVEIENIYDPAIQFEPIHRVIFGMGFDETCALLALLPGCTSRPAADCAALSRLVGEPPSLPARNRLGVVSAGRCALVETSAAGLATASLQPLLDRCLEQNRGGAAVSIDYIHGGDELFRLTAASDKTATGILLPPVPKAGLFETVARTGPLPRKSFSMGEPSEKRFYLECRKLFA
jgi:hypothetical protein